MKAVVVRYDVSAIHGGCGSYGSDLVIEDGWKWEVCSKCGEEIREIGPVEEITKG